MLTADDTRLLADTPPRRVGDWDWFWYILVCILPFVAAFVAIRWLATNRIGPGLAVLLTGWVAASLWFAVLVLVGIANA